MWWLNGEEALLLSGDRRMVKDDGMSPRLTLKKGCVRFLDEKGNPVTNYNVKIQ